MVCTDRGRMGLVGREVGGREWRAVMEGREWGGEQGMVGSGGGEGVNAYPMEYKMTTTITSSSSSPIRLRRLVPRH